MMKYKLSRNCITVIFFLHFHQEITCFNNSLIEEEVKSSLRNLGVEIHSDSQLLNWNDGDVEDASLIKSVTFTSHHGSFKIECQVFQYY